MATLSLGDTGLLASDPIFISRVKAAMIQAAINIASDGLTTGINPKRHAQVSQILNNPDWWKGLFAPAVATDATVGNAVAGVLVADTHNNYLTSTNAAAQAALATDAQIANAVSAMFNAFFGGQ
jgi:hypothetical protein